MKPVGSGVEGPPCIFTVGTETCTVISHTAAMSPSMRLYQKVQPPLHTMEVVLYQLSDLILPLI